MIEFKLSKENTKIVNSYMIKMKKSMQNEIDAMITMREMRKFPVTRSVNSYVREWKGHNNLYNLGLFKTHTKDVDLEEYIGIKGKIKGFFMSIIWLILGGI